MGTVSRLPKVLHRVLRKTRDSHRGGSWDVKERVPRGCEFNLNSAAHQQEGSGEWKDLFCFLTCVR